MRIHARSIARLVRICLSTAQNRRAVKTAITHVESALILSIQSCGANKRRGRMSRRGRTLRFVLYSQAIVKDVPTARPRSFAFWGTFVAGTLSFKYLFGRFLAHHLGQTGINL